jgi:hypothetical protein
MPKFVRKGPIEPPSAKPYNTVRPP